MTTPADDLPQMDLADVLGELCQCNNSDQPCQACLEHARWHAEDRLDDLRGLNP